MKKQFDFSGYATKANIKCTDGRTILKDAFKDNDGTTVPLVWHHLHNEPGNVLGHAMLENREDGVYAYGVFNNTPSGQNAKMLVEHKDITHLSIYANGLIEKSKNVVHGAIRELSLVLSGANPGALIENITIAHSDGTEGPVEDEVIIYTDSPISLEEIAHADPPKVPAQKSEDDETIEDVLNTFNEKQKKVLYALINEVSDGVNETAQAQHSDKGDSKVMKVNVFEKKEEATVKEKKITHLTHEQFAEIVEDAKKCGSFKEAFLAHAGTYGIDNISVLFPDAQTVSQTPDLYSRDMAWVAGVLSGTRHTPFSRIKSSYGDITVESARALGYVTGALKKEEVFALLTRTTTPTTIYKKQKLDRDDIIDITDMDVVAWLKAEMRVMLDEELARAVLVTDGRDVASADKIGEDHIRSIWKDDDMYAHHIQVEQADDVAATMEHIIRAREFYKGSGNPTLYTTTSFLTDMLLLKDTTDRRLYNTEVELASALRVSRIVEVPLMSGLSRDIAGPVHLHLLGIIVNLRDYVIGADKGGQVNMFDDFDIDYNQYKYLLETRCSGALTVLKSALVIEQIAAA